MDGELEQLGERIAEQAAHLDAAMHRLLADLRAFDERGGWHVQGALSCAHWLSWRVGWDLVTGRERVRVARRLGELPGLDDALRRGEVSYSKVRAMVRVATAANEGLLLEHARLMPASQLEVLCRKYALVQRHAEAPHPLGDEQRRYVRRRDTEDGMVKIEAVLHPEEAELVWTTLDHAAARLTDRRGSQVDNQAGAGGDEGERALMGEAESGARGAGRAPAGQDGSSADSAETRVTELRDDESACVGAPGPGSALATKACGGEDSAEPGDDSAEARADGASGAPEGKPGGKRMTSALEQRDSVARRAFNRADALMSLVQAYLRGDRPQRAPIEVTLTIPASSLRDEEAAGADPLEVGALGEGFVSRQAARRLSCDAGVVEVIEDELGVPLSVGRKRRTITGALRRALRRRDAACAFPGCTHRLFLEGHHLKHWADGGETSLSNGALLCSAHHRYVHEYGYTIELDAEQRPQFRSPHGWLVKATLDPPAGAEQGWSRIHTANGALAIDADTIACQWDGSPVDYGAVVGHLMRADGFA